MNSSTNNFQLNRIGNLIRYEWMNRKKMYFGAGLGVLLFLVFLFQYIFYSNHQSMRWETGYYHGVFVGGLFFLAIFATGQSFLDLREKKAARQFLLLPASHIEKFIVQFLGRFLLPLTIYPVLFWLAAVFSVEIFKVSILLFSGSEEFDFPESAQFLQVFSLPSNQEAIFYWLLWGIILLIPSLMFVGGGLFGKLNFILMPLSVLLFYGLMVLSTLVLSWIVKPDSIEWGDQIRFEFPNFDNPEIFPGVPLLVVVSVILIWMAVFLSYVVGYYRLTEKEA